MKEFREGSNLMLLMDERDWQKPFIVKVAGSGAAVVLKLAPDKAYVLVSSERSVVHIVRESRLGT